MGEACDFRAGDLVTFEPPHPAVRDSAIIWLGAGPSLVDAIGNSVGSFLYYVAGQPQGVWRTFDPGYFRLVSRLEDGSG